VDAIAEGVTASSIHGVYCHELAQIETEGGPVLHMLRIDSPLYTGFGEIYFSTILPGAVKAWKLHRLQTQLFAVPSGLVEVVIHDARENSPSRGAVASFLLGRPHHYRLLRVPPLLWYGFTAKGYVPGILANCADIPHSPDESERLPKDSPRIPYSWNR
jgi:dTDP-4-dehydrorhamnose 3,5-epimerase